MAIEVKIKDQFIRIGDLVRVSTLLVEKGKSRSYVFEGLVIAIKGRHPNKTFRVRRIAVGRVGVERIWPVESPWIKKVEVVRRGKVRRSKLYYLRDRKGRAALKVKTKEPVKKEKSEAPTARSPRRKPGSKISSK
ncbi:MAG: 50S ribosomal protein L19 [Candidatus Pacebacteria bacterium]|nr:50S ribosomal protein L19 [Candidatus Paceibacterota bacterium]